MGDSKSGIQPAVVQDKVTDKVSTVLCDFVKCSNCKSMLLVSQGQDSCPVCKMAGKFSWVEIGLEVVVYSLAPQILKGAGYLLSE